MRRATTTLLLIAGCFIFTQAHASSSSQTVPISDAEQIEVNVPMELHVVQGQQESLIVTADDRDMRRLRIKQEGDVLTIDTDDEDHVNFIGQRRVTGTLTVKQLTALHLNTAGKVSIAPLKADRLELAISGAGSMELQDVSATTVQMSIAGAGEIDASGAANSVNVNVSGIGAASLATLNSKSSRIAISGGGSVKIAVSDDLDATISGFGEIRYKGSPRITKAISGIGSITPLGS